MTALASNISAYAQLLQKTAPRIIRSKEENEHFTMLLEEITRKGGKATAAEEQLAELLTLLIEEFEETLCVAQIQTAADPADANGCQRASAKGPGEDFRRRKHSLSRASWQAQDDRAARSTPVQEVRSLAGIISVAFPLATTATHHLHFLVAFACNIFVAR